MYANGFCINFDTHLKQLRFRYPEKRVKSVNPSLLIGVIIIIIGIIMSYGINFSRTIGSWGQSFGETMGNWGERFGEDMGRFGQSIGEYFSEWGASFGRIIGSYVLIFIGIIVIVYQYRQTS